MGRLQMKIGIYHEIIVLEPESYAEEFQMERIFEQALAEGIEVVSYSDWNIHKLELKLKGK